MKQYKSYLCILLAAAAWGCIGLFSRRLLNNGFSPANIVTIRNFGGLLVLSLIFALFDRSVFRVKAKHLPIFFGTGIVSVLLFTLCYFNAQKLCSLAVSAILLYTAPAMVVVMSAVLWKEPITKKKLLALFLVRRRAERDGERRAVRRRLGVFLCALLDLRAVRTQAL